MKRLLLFWLLVFMCLVSGAWAQIQTDGNIAKDPGLSGVNIPHLTSSSVSITGGTMSGVTITGHASLDAPLASPAFTDSPSSQLTINSCPVARVLCQSA